MALLFHFAVAWLFKLLPASLPALEAGIPCEIGLTAPRSINRLVIKILLTALMTVRQNTHPTNADSSVVLPIDLTQSASVVFPPS